jgi:alpha-methylacyl-CoA racemase
MNRSGPDDELGGPLSGLRVLEFVGIGPGPYCGMLLADLGAEVVRIDRPGGNGWPNSIVDRGRQVIEVDLHTQDGVRIGQLAAQKADVLLEGFRPGVMERLGLGPEQLLHANPRLIYGRVTGWGQTGPLARTAGHDIDYIALTGALAAMGAPDGPPTPPLNLLGDLGGGALFLALGIVSALWERERSGLGQVVDAAIVDGVSSMMSMFAGLLSDKRATLERERSLLGGAAPFYRCYTCSEGQHIAVGALEPQFYSELLACVGAPAEFARDQYDPANWQERGKMLEKLFSLHTREYWSRLLEGTDACCAPVLTLAEARGHPHLVARRTYQNIRGMPQAGPVPRFSRTPGAVVDAGSGRAALRRWGIGIDE